jgi:nucleoside-diphosphate-sugar epimerase
MILVTGAGGIVGRAVCKRLSEDQIDFIPLLHSQNGDYGNEAIVVNLAEKDSLSILTKANISSIIHLAAAVPHSINTPDTDYFAELTRRIDLNIFSLKRVLGVPLIYMSTCGLYSRSNQSVKFEDDNSNIKLASPYFSAKWFGEQTFRNEEDCTILRLAAPIGPGLKSNLVLSKFIELARSNETIKIWGDGKREQNYVDTRDISELIVRVLANPIQTVFNVAALQPVTMYELAKIVISSARQGSISFAEQSDPLEGQTARYSIEKARMFYDWSPKIDLKSSCESIISENFNLNV